MPFLKIKNGTYTRGIENNLRKPDLYVKKNLDRRKRELSRFSATAGDRWRVVTQGRAQLQGSRMRLRLVRENFLDGAASLIDRLVGVGCGRGI